jgi:hypothetical protein
MALLAHTLMKRTFVVILQPVCTLLASSDSLMVTSLHLKGQEFLEKLKQLVAFHHGLVQRS